MDTAVETFTSAVDGRAPAARGLLRDDLDAAGEAGVDERRVARLAGSVARNPLRLCRSPLLARARSVASGAG